MDLEQRIETIEIIAITSHTTMRTMVPFTEIRRKPNLPDPFGRDSSIRNCNAVIFAMYSVKT